MKKDDLLIMVGVCLAIALFTFALAWFLSSRLFLEQ